MSILFENLSTTANNQNEELTDTETDTDDAWTNYRTDDAPSIYARPTLNFGIDLGAFVFRVIFKS